MRYLIWLWRSLMTRLQCAWQFIKDILFALLPARFSFIVLAIGFVLLAFIPQSQDVLIAFAEDKDIDNPSWLWFFLAVGWWAINQVPIGGLPPMTLTRYCADAAPGSP